MKRLPKLSELNLSVRAINILACNDIRTTRDLLKQSVHELFRIPNCGKVSIYEIGNALEKCGLELAGFSEYKVFSPAAPEHIQELRRKAKEKYLLAIKDAAKIYRGTIADVRRQSEDKKEDLAK